VPTEGVLAGNFTDVTEPPSADPISDMSPSDPDGPTSDGPTSDEPKVAEASDDVDLNAIERDLTGVEVALSRLAEGTYWTDEVTGSPIPDHVLAADPIARRA
jgi:RNA polymerase-binding transcription factor DksA